MVEVGELLCVSEPFVHVLANKEHEFRCESCLESLQLDNESTSPIGVSQEGMQAHGTLNKLWQGCNNNVLTQREGAFIVDILDYTCKRSDWNVHKKECRCLKRLQSKIPMDSIRLLLRLVIRFSDWGHSQEAKGLLTLKRSFNDLMSHEKEIKRDGKRCEQLSQHLFTLQKVTAGILDLPSSQDLMHIFGKMTTNSFTICGEEMQPIGTGIYLGPSLLDHRCKPNAVTTFQGKYLHLRAVEPIPNPSPSNVFISYIDQLDTTTERKKNLREQYYFDCDCSWCQDQEMEKAKQAIKCPKKDCHEGFVTVLDDDITITSCSACGQSISDEEFIRKASGLEEDCQRCLEEAKASKQSKDPERVLNISEKCMNCYADLFHPLNLNLVKVLDLAFDASLDLQQWGKAVIFGSKTLPAYRKYYPPYSPNVGIQLLKLGKIQLYLQNLKEALIYLQQADDILSVTHGRNHTLYKQLIELLDQAQEEMRTRLENGS